MKSIWYPTEKTVTGFRYATTASAAPLMLLMFVLPVPIIFSIASLFLALRGIVVVRGAITLPIHDETKEEEYGKSKASGQKTSKIIVMLVPSLGVAFSVFLAVLFLSKGTMFGLAVAVIIPMLLLPLCLADFIKLDRIEKENTKEIAEPIPKQ